MRRDEICLFMVFRFIHTGTAKIAICLIGRAGKYLLKSGVYRIAGWEKRSPGPPVGLCEGNAGLVFVGERAAIGLLFVRQLSAGGIDVFSAAAAEPGIDPILFEVLHELVNGILVGFCEKGLLDGVVFDDVDEVGGHLPVNLHQLVRILPAVVEILKEDILERDLVACLLIKMVQRLDEGLDVIGLVDGHDLVAFLIIGCMQRERQLELYLIVAELADHLGHARGRDGNAAGAHGQPFGRGDAFDGRQDILVIQQGFAHAHEDDVGELFFIDAFGLLVDEDDLVIDLVKVQVAPALHIAGGAEFTAERTADLRGDTGGLSFVRRDKHSFDQVAFRSAETAFDGAVGRVLRGVDSQRGQREVFGEAGAELLAEIGHVVEAVGMFLP